MLVRGYKCVTRYNAQQGEIIDDFTHGAAEELTVRNRTWCVFKAYVFFYYLVLSRVILAG